MKSKRAGSFPPAAAFRASGRARPLEARIELIVPVRQIEVEALPRAHHAKRGLRCPKIILRSAARRPGPLPLLGAEEGDRFLQLLGFERKLARTARQCLGGSGVLLCHLIELLDRQRLPGQAGNGSRQPRPRDFRYQECSASNEARVSLRSDSSYEGRFISEDRYCRRLRAVEMGTSTTG